MSGRAAALLCVSLCAPAAWCQEQTSSAPESVAEKVLVVGQRPGPGLWKVSRDEHVLWVFGTYTPLPAKMEWRSQEVESIIGNRRSCCWRQVRDSASDGWTP